MKKTIETLDKEEMQRMGIYRGNSFRRWILIGGSIGILFFLMLCGVNVLNPFFYDWLLCGEGEDRAVSFYGWIFYEKTPWTDSLFGSFDSTYPYELSLIFSDAVVPFAILFKLLFGMIIPDGTVTQYLGIWACTCYVLQGIFSALIVRKIINNFWIRILGIFLLCASPMMIQRLFEHNTLVAHWVILSAFCLFIYRKELGRKKYILWPILMMTSTSIHIYFLVIISIVMAFELLDDILKNKNIIVPVLTGVISILCSLFTIWGLGGFSSEISQADPFWGYSVLYEYSSNLNTFFNSDGNSLFLPALPHGPGEYEGYGYLGLGALILTAIASIVFLVNLKEKKDWIRNNAIDIGCVFGCFIVSVMMAVGPKVTLFGHTLFTIPLPQISDFFFATIRSIGRFIWIAAYMLIIIALYVIDKYGIRKLKRKSVPLVVVVLLIVQLLDLSPAIYKKHMKYANQEWESLIQDKIWQELADSHDYVYAIPASATNGLPGSFSTSMMIYVYKNNLKISSTRIAHPSEVLEESSYKYMDDVLAGNPKKDVIYWFANEEYMKQASKYLHTEVIDGFCIGWVE